VRTAIDQALEYQALREAAEDYTRTPGNPGSPEYRAAWVRFRYRIRTLDDLERWQASTRYRRGAVEPAALAQQYLDRTGSGVDVAGCSVHAARTPRD